MKYLKLFENQNFNHQKFKGILDEYELLCKNIIDYLNFIKISEFDVTVIVEMWYGGNESYFNIQFKSDDGSDSEGIENTYFLDEKKYNDLSVFLSDPELYMSAKKYNI